MSEREHLANLIDRGGLGVAKIGTERIRDIIEEALYLEREQLEAERAAEGKALKVNPYVTDSGKECDRAIVYSLTNVPPSDPLGTDALVNFKVGHAVEEAFARLLENAGALPIREVRIEIPVDGTVVSGRVDFLLATTTELIELKSTKQVAIKAALPKGEQGSPDHRHQLGLYLHAARLGLLGKAFEQIQSGLLVYLCKDAVRGEPSVIAYEVAYDEIAVHKDLKRLAALQRLAVEEVVPPRPAHLERNKYPCLYCGHRTFCWKEGE